MALNFKQVSAQNGLVESDLIAARTALPLAEILGEELKLTAVVRTHWKKGDEEGDRPGMIFDDYPNNWVKASGQNIQANIFAWATAANCPADPDTPECPFLNFDPLNEELSKQGGLKLMIVRSKTAAGNPFNKMVFLD